ncbi:MAG: OmpA family protein [Gammaproteobacteria bacterium]
MLVPLILGLIGLSILYWWAKESRAEFIENDLSIKSDSLLSEQKVGGVIVNMDGRDAVLTGKVESNQRSEEIETIIASLSGIRVVDNQLEIASVPPPPVELEPEPEPVKEPEIVPEIAEEPEVLIEPEPEPEVALAPETESVTPVEEAPIAEEVIEEILQTLDLSGITFLFGSDEITSEGTVILDDVANVLNEHPEFDVDVVGHTDNVGDEGLNLELSQRRALSVMNYLISQGIEFERMDAIGYGESKPITSNATADGRATNRRIDFEVTRRQ